MNQKRIVIIEGDAFDADEITTIVKSAVKEEMRVWLRSVDESYDYEFEDEQTCHHAMAVAILAWRAAVGDLPVVDAIPPTPSEPLPPPVESEESIIEFWRDATGRYYDTYGGQRVYLGSQTGRFIWNEGPPRRKNPLGPGASPINKVYVGEDGKPLEPQPI